jgi:hypothetical protein
LNGTFNSTTYNSYKSGNADSTDSHWKEGQFIAYRVTMNGITGGSGATGTHTLVFSYDTVAMSHHAEDYLGSYDATETTGPAAGENANNNNPCADVSGTGCTAPGTAPTPVSKLLIPKADLAGDKTCAGASGLSTTPTQPDGYFDLFTQSAASASLTGASYASQHVVTSSGTCTTTMSITINIATPGTWNLVLTFGGHIASALDWGVGNSASGISGSPYHVVVVSFDGSSTGAKSMQMKTSAVASLPNVNTSVSNTTISAGGSLTDTATLSGSAGTVTGSVQFTLCSNTITGCPQSPGGTPIGSPVTLVNGSATSPSFGSNLAPGNYCIGLVYTNDGASFYSNTYSGSPSGTPNGECFKVNKAAPTITTKLSSSSITVGGSVSDSATLSGNTSDAGGTVAYRYYTNLTACNTDTGAWPAAPVAGTAAGGGAVTAGLAAGSDTVKFTSANTYYWAVFYSGDGNNAPAASTCSDETLTVSNPITARIAPTNTTCLQFLNGSASTLGEVDYQTRSRTTIQNAQPGVFFYFIKVTAPAKSFTVDVLQTIPTTAKSPLFGITSTAAYDSSCNTFKTSPPSGGSGDDTIQFSNAIIGNTYVVAVKYTTKSIVGKPDPNPANVTYTFATNLNTVLVPNSAQTLLLKKTG